MRVWFIALSVAALALTACADSYEVPVVADEPAELATSEHAQRIGNCSSDLACAEDQFCDTSSCLSCCRSGELCTAVCCGICTRRVECTKAADCGTFNCVTTPCSHWECRGRKCVLVDDPPGGPSK